MSTSCACTVNRCGVQLGEIENVADEPLEAHRLGGDDVVRRVLQLRVVDEPVPQRVDVTLDRGQRRPELVRDGHQELALALLGGREPRRHLVEPLGEQADLVAAASGRDANRIVPLRDLVGRTGQRQHGAGDPARQPPRERAREQGPDAEGGCEPADERQPLVAQLGPRLRDDDRAERGAVGLEPAPAPQQRDRSGSRPAA